MPKKQRIVKIKERVSNLEGNVKMALGVVAFVILWMLSGIFSGDDAIVETKKVHAKKEIQALRVIAEPYTRQIILSATTEPYMLVNLAARIEGQIESISAKRGDDVEKGTILLSIEKEQRAEALQTAKYQLNQAQSLFNAAKNLNKEGYRADSSLDGRRAELAQAKENLKLAEDSLSYTKISSPINGFVEDRLVEVGDYVKKGTAVYQIVSKGRYKVVAYISQKDRGAIQVGSIATATLATGEEITGTITFIASNAHNITHTYKVEVDVKSGMAIPTGMSAKLSIPSIAVTAQLVPYAAMVLNDKGNLGAIILESTNKAKFVPINPLDDNGKGFYLTGLPKESLVVIKGQSDLIDGEIVIPHIVDQAPLARKVY
ncbi:MAG: multidrug efflux system membrane fusion protein [Alphaproteobacteria bacterium]|jgi:multidrug efflux system membrane fusion protein